MISYHLKPFLPMARATLCVSSPTMIPPKGVTIRSCMLGCSKPPSHTYSHSRECIRVKTDDCQTGAPCDLTAL